MAIQDQSSTQLIHALESTFGTAASAGGTSAAIRSTGGGVDIMKDIFQSQEIRVDQQPVATRHGGQRASVALAGELAIGAYDDFLSDVMRSSWDSALSFTQATGTSVSATGSVFTFGAGSLITAGFKLGDIVRFTNLPAGGAVNNNVNFRITAVTATTMTVTPAPTAFTSQTTFTLTRPRKLVMGTAKTSRTFEERLPDLDASRMIYGARCGAMSLQLPPNANAQINFQFQAQRGAVLEGASSPYFTSVTAQNETSPMTGIEGGLRMGGVEQAIVTSLDLQVNLNLSSTPVIGSTFVPDIFYGQFNVTGTVSAYLSDMDLVKAFLNETAVDIVAVSTDDQVGPKGFLAINAQNVKLTGASWQRAAAGGVIATFPWVASKATGSTVDAATLVIQRSNA